MVGHDIIKAMPSNWSKGFTKETHKSVKKISLTMRERKIDNFRVWREKIKEDGKIPNDYPTLPRNGDTAELIGVVLGDGNIYKFPRTECLTIVSNSNNTGFIKRYSEIVKNLFNKKVTLQNQTTHGKIINCIRIRIYQKKISNRLKVPSGDRSKINFKVPKWIWNNKNFLIRFLRGLYEAEGCFCVHVPTGTYKFIFVNKNQSLLNAVFQGLVKLGFHPHYSYYKVQISRKEEAYRCRDLIEFRKY